MAKAAAVGAVDWLDALPNLVADIERDWELTLGRVYPGATEALVADATLADGTGAVLKLLVPRGRGHEAAEHEITVLRLAKGDGCVSLLRSDEARGALLLERLGRSLNECSLPIWARHEILCAAAQRLWRPAPDARLPTGADKGRWLIDFIEAKWEQLDRPTDERTVTHALQCAERRIVAHDDERSVLVHGDVHEWNALESGGGFKLVDPDGLLAEPEYDLGILMREDPVELLTTDSWDRARWLARRTGLDPTAIWEWGVVERLSTGLLVTEIGLEPIGGQMLAAAERVSVRDRIG